MLAAITELVIPLKTLELCLVGTEDRVEEHILEDRLLHQKSKVAVLIASAFVPIVIWELDDLTAPESVFILVDLLPKVTPPLEIVLVDVEVVGVRKPAKQGRRERSEIGSAYGRQLTVNRSAGLSIVLPPLTEQSFDFGVLGTVGGFSLFAIRSP